MEQHRTKWFMKWVPSKDTTKKHAPDLYTYLTSRNIDPRTKFVVCKNVWDKKTKEIYHHFAAWDSFIYFYQWYRTLSRDTTKSYFEVVQPGVIQKPRFDIDVKLDKESYPEDLGQKVFDVLMKQIKVVLKEKNIKLRMSKDVTVYTSHGAKKFSMHVILQHWMHANEAEAYAFGHKVLEGLLDKKIGKNKIKWQKEWVDFGVYDRNQQFRLLGSTKCGDMRHKEFLNEFTFNGTKYTHAWDTLPESDEDVELMAFEESLLTFSGSQFSMIPSYVQPKKVYEGPVGSLEEDDVHQAMRVLDDDSSFTIKDVEGMLIYLYRQAPTFCDICKRPHEHENPFLRLERDHEEHKTFVYFYCHRDPDKRFSYLGFYTTPQAIWDLEDAKKIEGVEGDKEDKKTQECESMEGESDNEAQVEENNNDEENEEDQDESEENNSEEDDEEEEQGSEENNSEEDDEEEWIVGKPQDVFGPAIPQGMSVLDKLKYFSTH
jgi:hypothetical protein